MRKALALVVAALLLPLAACGGSDDLPFSGTTLDPTYQVADVDLVDDDGQPFSLGTDLDKRLTLVFFGYTRCSDGICPAVLSHLASALVRPELRDDRDDVDVIMVTSDPTFDTPEVLKSYMDTFDTSFFGLTGTMDQIQQVSTSLAAGIDTTDPGGHTTLIMGLDSSGEAPVYWGQDTTPAQFEHDIHQLLEDS